MDEQPQTREQWLAERRTGIGGSDAAAAVGVSKWKTPLQLYLEKRGEFHVEMNEPMRWGTLLEPVVRQEYSNRTGRTVRTPNNIIRHSKIPFALATVDGIADDTRLVECKTARSGEGWGEDGSADIPIEYMMQVQHCMAVVGLLVADVPVLIGGSDFRIYEVPADAELQEMLFEQEREFWQHVQAGDPPNAVSTEDVRRRWRFDNGQAVEATEQIKLFLEWLRDTKHQIAELEAKKVALECDIQSYMGEAAILNISGAKAATWKNINASRRFDVESFKDAHPDLYSQFLRDAKPQRRFTLLKLKGE